MLKDCIFFQLSGKKQRNYLVFTTLMSKFFQLTGVDTTSITRSRANVYDVEKIKTSRKTGPINSMAG